MRAMAASRASTAAMRYRGHSSASAATRRREQRPMGFTKQNTPIRWRRLAQGKFFPDAVRGRRLAVVPRARYVLAN